MDRGRLFVVGAINLDLVVAAPRLPAAGETVVGDGVVRHGGGKGANAAVAAARAGAQVAFVGALGTDSAAGEAECDLHDAGVDCAGIQRLAACATGMALIVVDPGGENQIAVGAGANASLSPAHVEARVRAAVSSGLHCLLISTEIPDAVVLAALQAAARSGVRCVLNPAPPTAAVRAGLASGPILTPNRGELAALLDDERVRPGEGARALGERTGAPVCVTLGSGGVIVSESGELHTIEAPRVNARDTTGAGDTFNGVLAAWLSGGAPLLASARAAVAAASLSVLRDGARAGMPTDAAIREAMSAAAGDGPPRA